MNLDVPHILILISSNLYVRNFVQSDAFSGVNRHYSCQWVVTDRVNKALLADKVAATSTIAIDKKREALFLFSMYLTMKVFHHRSSSFLFKFTMDMGHRRLGILLQILSLPILRTITLALVNFVLGKNREFERLLETHKPAIVIIPSQGNDLITRDAVAACRHRGIPVFSLISGWDNLSTKGVICHLPNFIGVWGTKTREHAIQIHRFKPEQVKILGVPHFECYRRQTSKDEIDRVREIHAIPSNKKIIILAGCSRDVAEIPLLKTLEQILAAGLGNEFHTIYRPHPWTQAKRLDELFLECDFKHITLDAQMKEAFSNLRAKGRLNNHPDSLIPSLDYYPALLASAECLISPLSTLLIESALNGKPAMAVSFNSAPTVFSLKECIYCEHFKYLEKANGLITCSDKSDFKRDLERLIALTRRADLKALLRKDIEEVVSFENEPYAGRLLAAVQSIIGDSEKNRYYEQPRSFADTHV